MWISLRTFLDLEALVGYFQAQAQVSASPVLGLAHQGFALSLVVAPQICPLYPVLEAHHLMHKEMGSLTLIGFGTRPMLLLIITTYYLLLNA